MAVEPDPVMAEEARRRAAPFPQVRVVNAAVSKQAGTVTLYQNPVDPRHNSLWRENVPVETCPSVRVPAVTLDELAAQVPRLHVIKIDAQGAEADILRGATETLQRDDLVWFVELWAEGLRHAGSSVHDVACLFAEAGWQPANLPWVKVVELAERKTNHGAIDVIVQKRAA